MEMMRSAVICAAAALLCTLLPRSEVRWGVALAAGLCVTSLCLEPLRQGAQLIRTLGTQGGVDSQGVMLRAVGVAMLAEFGQQLCRDAGESALAGRVELAGRVTMMTLALPLLEKLIDELGTMLP